MRHLVLIILLYFMCSSFALRHSGRTDSNDGHNCSSSSVAKGLCSGYHYHRKEVGIDLDLAQFFKGGPQRGHREMLSDNNEGLIGAIVSKNKKRKLEAVLKEHPNILGFTI